MKTKFNHAANDSPRSGSNKKVTPAVWGAIVIAIVAVTYGSRCMGKRDAGDKLVVVLAKAVTHNPRERFGGRCLLPRSINRSGGIWCRLSPGQLGNAI
jgi:hypothetical protein